MNLDEKLKRFDERVQERKPQEDEREVQRQESLRQDYLKRTGRKELRP